MGPVNKLLADVGGAPMIARVVDTVLASQARPVVVVVGYEAAAVRKALAGRDVQFVDNPEHADGISTSASRRISSTG
jgi:molybdenum cofactor cytidylyltransferase